ncbi:carbohydrate kinase [Anaerobacillus alkaliphilus]|uniref:Carbohydrate kinase n=1 Tax=Anaerobacillus alkaliphilus TaxID=1548597 RepID=A0A4Q0VV32_9BACI|nr:PfkB family carbohydrate kinase [Anaerobacillus alkaliphilus]RXJ02303.1 carbohydrate kinase [Anaerobacillus alkaliphilus]
MSKVLCLGELLIDFVPTENGVQLKDVPQFKKAAGGAPANVSAAIAKLGGNSSMIGKVGADPFGEFLIETLTDNGVSVDYLLSTTEAKTALAFVSLQKNGERDFMFYREPSADMLLEKEDLKPEWFEEALIYHFGSVSLIEGPVKEATVQGIELAKQSQTIISFDPNIRLPLWKVPELAKKEIMKQIPHVHILKISEEELLFLTNHPNEKEASHSLFKGSVKLILVTKGEKGCTYYTHETSGNVEGIPVQPLDTTGAGDAFVGGLLFQLSQQMTKLEDLDELIVNRELLSDILRFANVCGAITTTKRGAIAALPTKTEVLSLK